MELRKSRYYGRGYAAPRSYAPVYRGYYGGSSLYLGYGAPYGYAYDPGYLYAPGYPADQAYSYGPAPAPQACAPGSYDRNGNWIPNPNCSNPQQYGPPQQNYNYDQQQYPPQQPNYDPNQDQGYSR